MQATRSRHRFLLGVSALLTLALGAGPAHASLEFPGALEEAAGMPCTPSCTVCHGVNPGTAATFQNRKLGATLFTINGVVLPHDAAALKAAYVKYSMDPANAAAVAALKDGTDPETGDSLCGPAYGCGAHVAKQAPPSDFSAPLWVAGAVLAGGILRRRKSSAPRG